MKKVNKKVDLVRELPLGDVNGPFMVPPPDCVIRGSAGCLARQEVAPTSGETSIMMCGTEGCERTITLGPATLRGGGAVAFSGACACPAGQDKREME